MFKLIQLSIASILCLFSLMACVAPSSPESESPPSPQQTFTPTITATFTLEIETPSANTPAASQTQAVGTIAGPATALSNGTITPAIDLTSAVVDPTVAFEQTREAALNNTHHPGPTLGPGTASITPTIEPPTDSSN